MTSPSKETDFDYSKLFNEASRYATYRKNMLSKFESPEDFGSYCVEVTLRRKTSFVNLNFLFIDFLRKTTGRKDSKNYESRLDFKYTYSLDAPIGDGSDTTRISLLEDKKKDEDEDEYSLINQFNKIKTLLNYKNKRTKKIMNLYFDGMSGVEISKKFNVSTSRIFQIKAPILDKMLGLFLFNKLDTVSEKAKKFILTKKIGG